MPDKFEKFTDRARKVLTLAQEEAHRYNHNYIGTEHLLLGLLREGDGVAARVLANMGITLPSARAAVEHIIGRGDSMIVGEIGLTPRAKKVIELAVKEARRLNHHYVGTEHLLLGLLREGEGIAAGVLESMGASLEQVRAEVMHVITSGERPPESTAAAAPPVPPLPESVRQVIPYVGPSAARLGLVVAAASVLASLLTERKPRLRVGIVAGVIGGLALSQARALLGRRTGS